MSKMNFAGMLLSSVTIMLEAHAAASVRIAELVGQAEKHLERAMSRGDTPASALDAVGALLGAIKEREAVALAIEASPMYSFGRDLAKLSQVLVGEGFAPDEAIELAAAEALGGVDLGELSEEDDASLLGFPDGIQPASLGEGGQASDAPAQA